MEHHEWDYRVACADCDEVLDPRSDPIFAIDRDLCLCVTCAQKRGAHYDMASHSWTERPNLQGIV